MEEKDLVEIVEIYAPVKDGGEAYSAIDQKNLKRVAMIIGGRVHQLEEGYWAERSLITKKQEQNLFPN